MSLNLLNIKASWQLIIRQSEAEFARNCEIRESKFGPRILCSLAQWPPPSSWPRQFHFNWASELLLWYFPQLKSIGANKGTREEAS